MPSVLPTRAFANAAQVKVTAPTAPLAPLLSKRAEYLFLEEHEAKAAILEQPLVPFATNELVEAVGSVVDDFPRLSKEWCGVGQQLNLTRNLLMGVIYSNAVHGGRPDHIDDKAALESVGKCGA